MKIFSVDLKFINDEYFMEIMAITIHNSPIHKIYKSYFYYGEYVEIMVQKLPALCGADMQRGFFLFWVVF